VFLLGRGAAELAGLYSTRLSRCDLTRSTPVTPSVSFAMLLVPLIHSRFLVLDVSLTVKARADQHHTILAMHICWHCINAIRSGMALAQVSKDL
jgi:hypothetical protein